MIIHVWYKVQAIHLQTNGNGVTIAHLSFNSIITILFIQHTTCTLRKKFASNETLTIWFWCHNFGLSFFKCLIYESLNREKHTLLGAITSDVDGILLLWHNMVVIFLIIVGHKRKTKFMCHIHHSCTNKIGRVKCPMESLDLNGSFLILNALLMYCYK